MYRVMIVDDEAYFREYLRTTIPWHNYGFEICCEAIDGEDGLNKIPASRPDIVLADINMPVFNGLDFSKQVKEKYPLINIILITGYNEFEYARQAIQIGVADYISKPFEKQELIDSMLLVKKCIKERKKKDIYISKLQKQYNDTLPVIKKNILYNAVKGIYNNKYDLLIKELKSLKITLPDGPYIVSIVEIYNLNEIIPEERENLKKEVSKAISSVLEDGFISFEGDNDQIILITKGGSDRRYDLFISSCVEIITNINAKLDFAITIGIGMPSCTLSGIPDSYEKACAAIRNKFLLGSNKIIEFNSLNIQDASMEIFPFKLKNDLFMHLRFLDANKVDETLCSIYNFLKSRLLSIDYVYILYTELTSLCFSYLAEYGYNSADIFGQDFYPFKDISDKHTMKEVHEYVSLIYSRLIFYLNDNKKTRSMKVISKAKEYIDNNYDRSDLLIEDIAANVFFHPSYLRFLFKKEMGITAGEYLTKVRMIKAKELLKTGGLKFTAVASMVGYSDAAYFSKCFKKHYNICPSEYERSVSHST